MLIPFEISTGTARLFVLVLLSWVLFSFTSRSVRVYTTSSRSVVTATSAPHFVAVHPATSHVLNPLGVPHSSALSASSHAYQPYPNAALRVVERVSTSDSTAKMRYPKNLRRIYDGSWQVDTSSAAPFSDVPLAPLRPPQMRGIFLPPDAILSSRALVVNNTTTAPATTAATREETANINSTEPPIISHDFAFQERKGFALLTAENHQTSIEALHIVAGELLFRDGPYRTAHDVPLRLVGVYEWKRGVIYAVSDASNEDVNSVLGNLYDTVEKHHTREEMDNMTEGKLTKDKFVGGLNQPLVQMHKRMAIVRPVSFDSVSARCPFDAVFNVKQDVYTDTAPSALDLGSQADAVGQPGLHNSVGTSSLRYAEVIENGGNVSPPARGLQTTRRSESSSIGAQEEMVKMTGTFVSEKCKTKMSMELQTLDTEMLFVKAINYTLLVTVVAFTQVIVLIRQMEMTSTQAGASRVSLMTVGLQAVADSYLCLGHLTLGIAVHTLFNAFATAAFFKFICFSIFLMRWMLLIWRARRPSGFSEGWEAMRRELSMLYSRFYLSLLAGLFLLYQLQDHIRVFIFALYSFWLPQIVLNVVEDHRRPLLPMYILGTSLTRLAIPLYFWGCPNNFLHIHPLPKTVIALVGWLFLQALVLLSQYKFGPRWFIPKAFLPEKYDYFRPVTIDELEDEDLEAQNKEAGEGDALVANEPTRECCICMETVLLHSSDRMVTPCGHYFHADCLTKWLEVRLECALCRRPVPPP